MNPFFAKKLQGSASDIGIVSGVIAEIEGVSATQIKIEIKPKSSERSQNGAADDLEKL